MHEILVVPMSSPTNIRPACPIMMLTSQSLGASSSVRSRRCGRPRGAHDHLMLVSHVHLFRERLKEIREESEARGSISLVLELDHLIGALEGTVASARREALAVAGRFARVIPFLERSA